MNREVAMAVHISDSAIFKNSWSTPQLRELFDDKAILKGWIETLLALAQSQAVYGMIPGDAAEQLTEVYQNLELDQVFLDEAREGFERSNHSLLGLIRALQRRSPGTSGEWWCYGAAVQDITDTHTARLLLQVRKLLSEQLDSLVWTLCELAAKHRNTPMCGRTHGQPGLPITFGFKAAVWLDEIQRHRERLTQIGKRLDAGQLGGGVGSLSALGADALAVQKLFMEKLGLQAPNIAWTVSRDRLAEWLNLLTLITATADRIGHEIYNLQRPEIGEVSEGFVPGTVGSITMPQKRNPEISEHLGTLARTVRYHAAQMNENLVHDHERDGRSWKSEWAVLPGACLMTQKCVALLQVLLEHLQVHEARMLENLTASKGYLFAEQVMLALTPHLGKQSAHDLVYRIAMVGSERGMPFKDALLAETKVVSLLGTEGIDEAFNIERSTGSCGAMVDQVLAVSKTWQPSDA